MKLIVGLGNPGEKYARTRHNIGYRVADAFARRYRISFDTHEKEAMTGRGRAGGGSVMVAKPLTYMNLSGKAVASLVRSYLDSPADLMVVYDEIDLPLAKLRLRENGSAGTHNGMKSIIEELGTEQFPRLRFGIRADDYGPTTDLATYVLSNAPESQEELIEPAIARSVEALFLFARGDLRRAMNEFNRDPVVPATENP
jgi:PTH1 family peptidyl-tRNA hydrolase